MSQLPDSAIILLLVFVIILLILCAIIAWTIRISFRIRKLDLQKSRIVFFIAFLQVLLGVIMMLIIREINYNVPLAIGSGAGLAILTGLFSIKWFFKFNWKQVLGTWLIATGLQVLIVPVFAAVMLMGWAILAFMLNPPRL